MIKAIIWNTRNGEKYVCENREQALKMVYELSRKTRGQWVAALSVDSDNAPLFAPIEKAMKRHEQKEVKRAFREAWQAVKEIEQAAREAHATNKEIETMLNKVDYINFMAHHIVGHGVESNSRDMTREEREEWADKFFED